MDQSLTSVAEECTGAHLRGGESGKSEGFCDLQGSYRGVIFVVC